MWYLCLTMISGVCICRYRIQDYKIVRKCDPTSVTQTGKSLEMENACLPCPCPSTEDCPLLVSTDHSLCAQLSSCQQITTVLSVLRFWVDSLLGCWSLMLWEKRAFRKSELMKGSLVTVCPEREDEDRAVLVSLLFLSSHERSSSAVSCAHTTVHLLTTAWPADHRPEHRKLRAQGTCSSRFFLSEYFVTATESWMSQ